MDHTGGWKLSQYTPEMGVAILRRLGAGATIARVCADPEMPSVATLHRWRHVHEDFAAAYESMRDGRAQLRRLNARLAEERAPRRDWVAGQRSTYERRWAKAFCARVARGEAVYRICAEPQMPSVKAVYGWLARRPEFRAMYTGAKAEGLAWLAFQADMVVDRLRDGPPSRQALQAARLEVAGLEGRMGRLKARTWR